MKILFDIKTNQELPNGTTLLLEAGKDYCCYAYWNKPSQSIERLKFISYEETESSEHLATVIEDLSNTNFQKVVFSSGFAQSILSPSKFFNNNYEALDIIYDEPGHTYKHDVIAEWQMVNLYSIPSSLEKSLETFPSVEFIHAYTPLVKLYNGFIADNQLSVHFTPQRFRVFLKKGTAIQLAQTYFYTTPLDVIYYLLKICQEFELEQSFVFIILSGLVEKDSALFAELNQYFNNLHFAHPPQLKLPTDDHPHHFFTSLYNLAACVS